MPAHPPRISANLGEDMDNPQNLLWGLFKENMFKKAGKNHIT